MKGYIYAIRSPNTDLLYIGSTIQKPRQRFANHKTFYNKYGDCSSKLCSMSYKILERGDAYIDILDEIEMNNRNELFELEKKYILESGDNIVNKSSRVQTKYYNKDKRKDYYNKNRERRCEYQREYRKRIKEIFE